MASACVAECLDGGATAEAFEDLALDAVDLGHIAETGGMQVEDVARGVAVDKGVASDEVLFGGAELSEDGVPEIVPGAVVGGEGGGIVAKVRIWGDVVER